MKLVINVLTILLVANSAVAQNSGKSSPIRDAQELADKFADNAYDLIDEMNRLEYDFTKKEVLISSQMFFQRFTDLKIKIYTCQNSTRCRLQDITSSSKADFAFMALPKLKSLIQKFKDVNTKEDIEKAFYVRLQERGIDVDNPLRELSQNGHYPLIKKRNVNTTCSNLFN